MRISFLKVRFSQKNQQHLPLLKSHFQQLTTNPRFMNRGTFIFKATHGQ